MFQNNLDNDRSFTWIAAIVKDPVRDKVMLHSE